MREVSYVKTDLTLQDQVQQELRWDSRLDAADIGVAVSEWRRHAVGHGQDILLSARQARRLRFG
jgi:hypothetical protein